MQKGGAVAYLNTSVMPRDIWKATVNLRIFLCSGRDLNRGSSAFKSALLVGECVVHTRTAATWSFRPLVSFCPVKRSCRRQGASRLYRQRTKQIHRAWQLTCRVVRKWRVTCKLVGELPACYLQRGKTLEGRWTSQRVSSRRAGCWLWAGRTIRWSGSRRTRVRVSGSAKNHSWGWGSDRRRRESVEHSKRQS